MQKRAVRIMMAVKPRTHTEPLFKDMSIMGLKQLHHYSVLLLMLKLHRNALPCAAVSGLFILRRSVCNVPTRQSGWYAIPKTRLTSTLQSIRYLGPKFFNAFQRTLYFQTLSFGTKILPKKLIKKYIFNIH